MHSSSLLVSILIPLYNAEDWIADTIKSALNQTWEHTEIIVVDDGSTDDSLEVARSIEADELTVISQSNQGACVARNHAFERSRGGYIQYLDADDLLAPDKIETQVQRLEASDSLKVAYTRWGTFTDTPKQATFENTNKTWRDFDDPIDWLVTWASGNGGARPHAWLTPRPLIERAGPWDERLRVNQDGEFFSRVLLESDGIAYCGDTAAYYRRTDGGVSSRRDREAWESLFRSFELITQRILEHEDTPRTRRPCANKWMQFRHRVYPDCPDLVKEAEERINALGGTDYTPTTESTLYSAVRTVIGWKSATYLQEKYRKFRYGDDQ
jgi:glycosyltransferase involved in cell wall biosynthesis